MRIQRIAILLGLLAWGSCPLEAAPKPKRLVLGVMGGYGSCEEGAASEMYAHVDAIVSSYPACRKVPRTIVLTCYPRWEPDKHFRSARNFRELKQWLGRGVENAREPLRYRIVDEHGERRGEVGDSGNPNSFLTSFKQKFVREELGPLFEGRDSFVALFGHSHGGGSALMVASELARQSLRRPEIKLGGLYLFDPISRFECTGMQFYQERIAVLERVMRQIDVAHADYDFGKKLEHALKELESRSPCLRAPADISRSAALGVDYRSIDAKLRASGGAGLNFITDGYTLHSGDLPSFADGPGERSIVNRDYAQKLPYSRPNGIETSLPGIVEALSTQGHGAIRKDIQAWQEIAMNLRPQLERFCASVPSPSSTDRMASIPIHESPPPRPAVRPPPMLRQRPRAR